MFNVFFRDKKGRLVLFQFPNLSLLVFAIASLLARIVTSVGVGQVLKVISLSAIYTWALLEIFTGATYFRRLLGLVVFGCSLIATKTFLQSIG